MLDLDREEFLRDYWQRQALLIPYQGNEPFQTPLPADELGGLAMEPEIESRIVRDLQPGWELKHGPFSVSELQQDGAWSLLVQAVDHHVDAVAELRNWVNFIPSWRIDDVMVSYATDGGSVGPHFDNYDVFLVQGEGQREYILDAEKVEGAGPYREDLLHFVQLLAESKHNEILLTTHDGPMTLFAIRDRARKLLGKPSEIPVEVARVWPS